MSKFLFLIMASIYSSSLLAEGMIWTYKYSLEEAREMNIFIEPSCRWKDRCQIEVRVPTVVQEYPLSGIEIIKNNIEVPLSISKAENGYSIGYFIIKGKDSRKLKVKLDYSQMVDQIHWNHVFATISLKKINLTK